LTFGIPSDRVPVGTSLENDDGPRDALLVRQADVRRDHPHPVGTVLGSPGQTEHRAAVVGALNLNLLKSKAL
jgi:hypothetical protein